MKFYIKVTGIVSCGQNGANKDRKSNVIGHIINCERRNTDGMGKIN